MKNFTQYHFSGQKENEEILKIVHRHWFDIFSQMAIIFLMVFTTVGSFLFFPTYFPDLSTGPAHNLFVFLVSLFGIITWLALFVVFIDYYFDIWIITSKRIVNISQIGLFSRQVSEMEMERVQDVSTKVDGVIATFLNFGGVLIQTAGELPLFEFRNVPNPYEIKDLLMNLQNKAERAEADEFGEIIREKLKEG